MSRSRVGYEPTPYDKWVEVVFGVGHWRQPLRDWLPEHYKSAKAADVPDWSAGDVIAAESDGTIVLDDGITTWNPERAKQFLSTKAADAPDSGDHGVGLELTDDLVLKLIRDFIQSAVPKGSVSFVVSRDIPLPPVVNIFGDSKTPAEHNIVVRIPKLHGSGSGRGEIVLVVVGYEGEPLPVLPTGENAVADDKAADLHP